MVPQSRSGTFSPNPTAQPLQTGSSHSPHPSQAGALSAVASPSTSSPTGTSSLTKIVVAQVYLLLSTIKEDKDDPHKWDLQVDSLRKVRAPSPLPSLPLPLLLLLSSSARGIQFNSSAIALVLILALALILAFILALALILVLILFVLFVPSPLPLPALWLALASSERARRSVALTTPSPAYR